MVVLILQDKLIASEELIFLSSHKMYYALGGAFFSLLMRCIRHYMVLSVI